MAISIQCQCSRQITVSDALAGQPTRCPSCGRRHVVPRPVPQAPVYHQAAPQVPSAPLSGKCCRECGAGLIAKSAFCHSCGLPTVEPDQTVEAFSPHDPAFAAPQAPVAAPAPIAAPQQPQPAQMASPFAGGDQAEAAFASNKPSQPQQQPKSESKPTKPAETPATPLGNLAMACAYISMLLGMISVGIAVPMMRAASGDHCAGSSCGFVSAASNHMDQLVTLQYAVLSLIALFTMFGLFMGFLGLFHVGKKRGVAAWGLILCFLLGAFAAGGMKKVKQLDAQFNPDPIYREAEISTGMENCPSEYQGCTIDTHGCIGSCGDEARVNDEIGESDVQ